MSRDEITKEDVESVRDRALTKFDENFNSGVYDERDVDKFKTDDGFVKTFIRGPGRLDEAVDLVHESLKWRNEFKINDITEDTFERWAWERGAVYFHNVDKDGHAILYFRVKEHKRGEQPTEKVKQFVAYWLESAFKEKPHEKIVVLFDMASTGLSNLDMDLIKFVITSFKLYYPTLLAYLLVYEMPWVLSAAWKVIKSWLNTDAQSRLKFVTKSDIQEYINKDQLMEHMGGTDTFKYKYIPPEERESGKKKVTFADQTPAVFRSFSENLNEECKPNGIPTGKVKMQVEEYTTCIRRQPCSPTDQINGILNQMSRLRKIHEDKINSLSCRRSIMSSQDNEENCFNGRLLTIKPAEVLEFSAADGSKEAFDIVFLTNTLPYPIAYKVKTTSPEKYRVRPSYGIVKPGSCSKVFIYLHAEYNDNVHKDRFLIMAMELTDDNCDNAVHLWKCVPKDSIMEHRLRCIYNPCARSPGKLPRAPKLSAEQQLIKISDQMQSMIRSNNRQEYLIRCLLLSVFFLYGIIVVILFILIRHPEWLNIQTTCKSVLF
ncbi:motile sperm domain-containing protein 2-like isoform X2 [Gigantopelta aegis]|uniref:motile sperm domain-containing protein 2-like isoform X2 n=1 Tax=Gigantopelta aegis TaxID=1735272 RepID=UPI001B889EBC|nr:motile sperm domain-containing protein 2-like isoform X2 [Gigantopelta aegis]